jgi:hypothetical protein
MGVTITCPNQEETSELGPFEPVEAMCGDECADRYNEMIDALQSGSTLADLGGRSGERQLM